MIVKTVDELGRVVIPCDMRSRLGINTKSKVSIEAENGVIMIKVADINTSMNLCEMMSIPCPAIV